MLLERYLKEQDFSVTSVASGRRLDETLAAHPVKLVILDLMLPGEDGLSICRRLRGRGEDVPIIILTAKGDEVDRIVGLELGADDYVPKPFSPRELVARVRSVLRRVSGAHGAVGTGPPGGGVRAGPFVVYEERRRITFCGTALDLTRYEYGLLRTLISRPGRVFSRDELLTRVWGD